MSTTWLRQFSALVGLAVILLLTAACAAPAPAPTLAPTTAAQPTAAPTEPTTAAPTSPAAAPTTAAAFRGSTVGAPDCNYGTADVPALLRTIEAVDQYTVRFTLCNPDPAFPAKVAFIAFAIQDKEFLDANGGDSVRMSEKPNGTGPYMVREWVRGDHITFEANPNYWGDKAQTPTVVFRWSPEAAQRLLELQSGNADGIDNPGPDDFATIQGDSNLKLYDREGLNIFYLGMNNKIEPFDDERVRQAIAMGIDRQRIVDNFYPPGSTAAEQFLPSAFSPGYTQGLEWYDYNPEQARRLLADAGFPNGFDVQMSYRDVVRGYLPLPGQVAQDLQAQLRDIGINVTINVMESGAFIDATAAGTVPLYLLGWNADYPDASNFMDYHFANVNNLQFGNLYSDIAQAIRAAGTTADTQERQTNYDRANTLIKQHVPMTPVAHGGSATAFKASVRGAHSSPLSNEYFAVMSTGSDRLVWVQNAEPISLWCADETDGETLRACEQTYEALLSYEVGGVEVQPGLAEEWESNTDLTQWTFNLRQGVKFHNGADFDANDVVASFEAQWNAKSPNHKGRTGQFEYFGAFFGAQLNRQ